MKIAVKSEINFRNTDEYPIDEFSIAVIYFNSEENSADFAFQTIDFPTDVVYNPYEELIDSINPLCSIPNLASDFYVLDYTSQQITIALVKCDALKPKYKIGSMEFSRALLRIYEDNDFGFLEECLVPLSYPSSTQVDSISSSHLPTIENYLQEQATEIRRVYYPGAGLDFSPFQLFGKYIDGVHVYYTDYMSILEIDMVIQRLEGSVNTRILTPQDFRQDNWEDFWPKYMSLTEMMGCDPKEAWARKFDFCSKDLNCMLTYLGTEGVQTVKILCENQLAPDVLVLQDHGGSTNYALFSGENSFLHEAMQNCLPKYILMDPTGAEDTKIWSGYEQVTQAYLPKVYESLSQNKNPRALFKREK